MVHCEKKEKKKPLVTQRQLNIHIGVTIVIIIATTLYKLVEKYVETIQH